MTKDPSRPPDKLSLVVFSGDFARVHYALVLASGAVAIGTPATVFFTREACRLLTRDWRSHPANDGRTAGEIDTEQVARGVAGFEELLRACAHLGARIIACEMGLAAIGLAPAELRDDIPIEIAGVVTFLADASADGMSLFV